MRAVVSSVTRRRGAFVFAVLALSVASPAQPQRKVEVPLHTPSELLFWKGSFQSAQQTAALLHTPILLDFYHDANPFVDRLDSIVYHDPDVIFFAGRTVLPFRVHAELQDSGNAALVARYDVRDFPTVVFARGDGTEIDRIVGYVEPRAFLVMLQNCLNDTNTIGALRAAAARDTNDLALAFRLAERHELRVEVDSALPILRRIAAHDPSASPAVATARLHLAVYALRAHSDPRALEALASGAIADSLRREALVELATWYTAHKQLDSGVAKYRAALAHWPRDAALWNNCAWALVEQRRDLDTALAYVDRALALDSTQADFFDTRCDVLLALGRVTDARRALDHALALRPTDAELAAKRAALDRPAQPARRRIK